MVPPEFNAEDEEAVRLLRGIAAGSVEDLEGLYAIYYKPLFSLIYKIVHNAETAEEILQDTFVRVWSKARDYQAEHGKPFSWLVTISRRLAVDRLRKKDRRPKFVSVSSEQNNFPEDQYSKDFDKIGEKHVMQDWLRTKLDDLPEAQRRAISLAFFQGLTQQEIADELDRPLGTIKSDIRRGLLRLREISRDYH